MAEASVPTLDPMTLVALAGHLALATMALARTARSPLAGPLALLCLDLFVFNAADAIQVLHPLPAWNLLDRVGASLLAPLAFDFVLVFVGRSRGRLRHLRRALWLYFVGIAGVALASALGWTGLFGLGGAARWAMAILPGALVMAAASLHLLLAHRAATAAFPIERARVHLVLAAYAVGLCGNFADLAANAGAPVLHLGPLANFAATLLLATVALGFGLFDQRLPAMLVVNGVVAGLVQLFVFLAIFRYLGDRMLLAAVMVATLGLAAYSVVAAVRRAAREREQRLAYHATLGRFAEQMAHDLRNPVAAIRGAAQLLEGEKARGTRVAEVGEYLTLILEQADRIGRVVTEYQRLGRVDPRRATVDVGDLVQGVAAAQALAAPPGITVECRVEPGLPRLQLDRELLEAALENLVRNAFEATPGGGRVALRAGRVAGGAREVQIEVEDRGAGMDARVREQVFAEFFTTKASGSGLGLAFVRRVIEAHEGTVSIDSGPGRGTTVRLHLPVPAEPAPAGPAGEDGGPGAAW